MTTVARRLGCTDGQVYTLGLGLVLAVGLLVIGIPPVLRAEKIVVPIDEVASPVAKSDATSTDVPDPAVPTPPDGTDRVPPAARTSTIPPGPPPVVEPRPPAVGPPHPAAPPSTPVAAEGLVILSHGYVSASGGTPLSGPEVPEDGIPVAARLGRLDKASFVRLAGTGNVLDLRLVDDPAANQLTDMAAVVACSITEADWTIAQPGAPTEQAPEHDPEECADGRVQPDGLWRFDLSGLGSFDPTTGLALVPVIDGPAATFQVTFAVVREAGGAAAQVRAGGSDGVPDGDRSERNLLASGLLSGDPG